MGQIMGGHYGGAPAPVFLEFLRQLPRDADQSIGCDPGEQGEGALQAVRAFEKDTGFIGIQGGGKDALPLATFHREESAKIKRIGRKPTANQGSQHGAGAGEDLYR